MKLSLCLAALLLSANVASAQIIQAVNRFANPGENENKSPKAVASGESEAGANLLTQASAQAVGSDTTQIGLQAVDLWINKYSRLYARLTLPLNSQNPTQPSSQNSQSNTSTASASTTQTLKISDGVIKQLVDPFGGLFNLSGGVFSYLGKAGRGVGEQDATKRVVINELKSQGKSSADSDVMAAVSQIHPDHGAFFDARGGFKFIDLPSPSDNALAVGSSKVSVFYTGIAGIKYIANLYDVAPMGTSADDGHLAGGLTLGAYIVGNYAADPTQSSAIPTLINRGTAALTGVIGVNLPQIAAITFSVTPWTSDSRLGKTFVFGFNVLRPTKDTPGGNGNSASTAAQTAQPNSPNEPAQPAPSNALAPTPSTRTDAGIRGIR